MPKESITIGDYFKQKPKACKRALIANIIMFLGLVYFTIKFFLLGFNDLESTRKQITIGFGVVMILLDALMVFALKGFLKGNKLAKIFFMLIAVFASVFAMGYQLIGVLIMVFLIVALFINVSCYSKLYPQSGAS